MQKTKLCTKCHKSIIIENFYFCKLTKDKLSSWCKDCTKKMARKFELNNQKHVKDRQQKRYKTNPWSYILSNIKRRCEDPNCDHYEWYGKLGIKCLITIEEIKELAIKYNYWKLKHPTIDRKDKSKDYTFNNCQFIEHSINSGKDKRKILIQYDKQMNFIKEWESVLEASKYYKISPTAIYHAIKKQSFSLGFIWKYKYE